MSPRRRAGLATLAAGTVLLALATRLLPASGPPLFDGLCLVNPYQSLSPAAGRPAATDAGKTIDVSGGQPASELITGETPPQATVDIGDAVLDVPPGTASVRLSITPVPAPGTLPADGRIDGNVYRVRAATASGAPVPLRPGRTAEVLLRPTAENPSVPKVIERRDGDRWTRLDTSPMNCADTQAAVTPSFGDFAVVLLGQPSPTSGSEGGGAPVGLLVTAVVVLVITGGIAAIRIGRARRGA